MTLITGQSIHVISSGGLFRVEVASGLDEVHPSGAILLRPEIRLLEIGCATMPGRVCTIPARRVQIS